MMQFKPGDVVLITCKAVPLQWRNAWVPEMDRYVGDGIARKVLGANQDIVLKPAGPHDDIAGWGWPAETLTLVSDYSVLRGKGTQVSVQIEDAEDELLEPMTLEQVEQIKELVKKELTPQEKLIQYRRSLRDLIGQG